MAGAVKKSSMPTGKPAADSVEALQARVREGVVGTTGTANPATRGRQRSPRDREHTVDVEQHRPDSLHGLTVGAAGRGARQPPAISATMSSGLRGHLLIPCRRSGG